LDIYDIILKKRDSSSLTDEEWKFAIDGYFDGNIEDYQMASLLMAGYLRGLDKNETIALTSALANSGKKLSWPDGPYVDKHSTGGVGDKITLIAIPLAAAAGCKIPKLSGKGLGHTGGTIDKLLSIPGFTAKVREKDFWRIIDDVGCAIVEAEDIAPADKPLYSLRDLTATVDSIPYITASILGKKIAAGAPNLIFDIKYGSGAFMETRQDAEELAFSLLSVGSEFGRRCRALITSMEQPLGNSCGNALEVAEALEVLRGGGPKDVRELSVAVAAEMLKISGIAPDYTEAEGLCAEILNDGRAYERFNAMATAQGATPDFEASLPKADKVHNISASNSGYVSAIDSYAVGRTVVALGGGREKKGDEIDYSVGVVLKRKLGDKVNRGEVLAEVHSGSKRKPEKALSLIGNAFFIDDEPVTPPELIANRL
jgi:pyrimidine-nucleoside phosphorylase